VYVAVSAGVYTLRDRLEVPVAYAAGTDLLWIPHYNVPLFVPGRLVVTIHDGAASGRPEFIGGDNRRLSARALFGVVAKRAARDHGGPRTSHGPS